MVIAIASILTAIALPRYEEYRRRSFDLRARYDLLHAATAEEAYFIDHETYISCENNGCIGLLPGIAALSPGVTLSLSGDETGFSGTATHPRGTGRIFRWESQAGGFVE